MISLWILAVVLCAGFARCLAFDMSRNDNLAVYWGQDDSGPSLPDLCNDTTIDTIPIAFVDAFTDGKLSYGFGDCSVGDKNCNLESTIQTCHDNGKIVTVSIGGGGGSTSLAFTSATEAKAFGELIYNTFLGGTDSGAVRPFGNAILDGIDLDIEKKTTEFYSDMVNAILSKDDGNKYYVTGAPQCDGPPDIYMKQALMEIPFDAIYIQFYNNDCGLNTNGDPINFDAWDAWMKANAKSNSTKLYIGAMGAKTSTDTGYVDIDTLQQFVETTRNQFPDSFGGVMLWDATLSQQNDRYDSQIKTYLAKGASGSSSVSSTATKKTSTTKVVSATSSAPSATMTKKKHHHHARQRRWLGHNSV